MKSSIYKTFLFNIPSDDGEVMITGIIKSNDPEIPIAGWEEFLVYDLSFASEKYPENIDIEAGDELKFLIGPNEDTRIGRINDGHFEEIIEPYSETPTFFSYITTVVFEILLINPDKAHYDYTNNSIYPEE